ncbi:sulfite exporter TauE/SafE family protein [Palleronia aestuarii]|uniref:sulfite exporter TauE/SafE family protein n=1 Tax=Palleronia aestuarii TaxID=568105 RepID=UPI001B870C95|nr:sulfite exporter TauE/SafE family protein [Palleronia aestuarii]
MEKAFDGDRLLFFFALLMMGVAIAMFLKRDTSGGAAAKRKAGRWAIAVAGGVTGLLSGFFGIGGGFLIVPALMWTTGMPILDAVGTSLFAVASFGLTTASNYAFSGFVDWPLTAALVAGGAAGSVLGERGARYLSTKDGRLDIGFSARVFVVAIYMAIESQYAVS